METMTSQILNHIKLLFIGLFNYLIIRLFTSAAYAAAGQAPPVNTAFGPFPTDPGGLVSKLFSIILSIAGAAALILIVYGGYQYTLSQGNQEKAQQAKEIITSAIAGLLFIIFSAVILRVIGIDVLGLGSIFK